MDTKYYIPELGIDGTAEQLITWAYRYSETYSNEALEAIYKIASNEKNPKAAVPLYILQDRKKKENDLPYTHMKADYLINDYKPSYSETKEYGEVEIITDRDKVLLSITGCDEGGCFTAANSYTLEEFMSGEPDWLEKTIGETLYFGKIYE